MAKLPSHLYGESIFTTTRTLDSKILFEDEHIKRLLDQVNDYYFLGKRRNREIENALNLKDVVRSNAHRFPNHVLRINVFANERIELIPNCFSLSDLNLEIIPREFCAVKNSSLKTFESPFSKNNLNLKAGSYFQNFYFKRLARDSGFSDALFISNGEVTEATTSNIIFCKSDMTITPANKGVFSGLGIEVIRRAGIEVKSANVKMSELRDFDKCFLINSATLLTPISRIDNLDFEVNANDPIMRKLDTFLRSYL